MAYQSSFSFGVERQFSPFVTFSAILVLGLLLSGCAGTQKPDENIRSSVRTAPADLQLTCSSETVTRLQLSGEQLLPISSAEVSPNVFRVDFNTQGGPVQCLIDQSGTVLSVERVGAAAS